MGMILHLIPVSFIKLCTESSISFTLCLRSFLLHASNCSALYVLMCKKQEPVHIVFWKVMKCHGKCMK